MILVYLTRLLIPIFFKYRFIHFIEVLDWLIMRFYLLARDVVVIYYLGCPFIVAIALVFYKVGWWYLIALVRLSCQIDAHGRFNIFIHMYFWPFQISFSIILWLIFVWIPKSRFIEHIFNIWGCQALSFVGLLIMIIFNIEKMWSLDHYYEW